MLACFARRLPQKTDILPVYALVLSALYGWSISLAIWKLPSWLYSLTIVEIVSLNAYVFLLNFLESLLILGCLLGLCLVLPDRFLKDVFAVRGSAIALCILASIMLHLNVYANTDLRMAFIHSLPAWWGATLAITLLVVWLSIKISWLKKFFIELSDRLVVFLYIFIPIAFVSLLIVLVRNIV
jgi:hypothetical protein